MQNVRVGATAGEYINMDALRAAVLEVSYD